MSRKVETVKTTGGATWHKKLDSADRTYYHKEGAGRKSPEAFAAAKSHTVETEVLERGNLGGIEAIDDVTELGGEYSATLTRNVNQYERGSAERKAAADVNRWLGFKHSDKTPDDPLEAAQEYHDMKQELKEATDPDDEQEIKERYNIGGS